MLPSCEKVCQGLREDGYEPTLVNARFVKPLDVELLDQLAKDHSLFVTVEENVKSGGYGEACESAYMEACHPEAHVLSATVCGPFCPSRKCGEPAGEDRSGSGRYQTGNRR